MSQQGAPHPRMHGLTHVGGGPDPIPGLLPPFGDSLDDFLEAQATAFWKLDETTGVVAHDSSGNGNDLTSTAPFLPPVWGQPAGPPGTTTAKWDDEDHRVSSSVGDPLEGFTDEFTGGVWVMTTSSTPTGEIIGQGQPLHSLPGWGLQMGNVGGGYRFYIAVDGNVVVQANDPITPDTWYLVAVVRDDGVWKLYVDGLLQAGTASDDPGSGYGNNTWLGNNGTSGHTTWLHQGFLSYGFIVDRPMSSAELLQLIEMAAGGGSPQEGWVLELDENGNPVWVPPGEVTVNGDDLPNSNTPLPPFTDLPDDPTEIDPALQWMMEQPFTWNGPDFQVPPRKWTTIPFTEPLMERQSNVTGGSTTWFELEWYDERAAGWVNPATPRVITIPHDMPFFSDVYSWMQICLKLEVPAVEPQTLRALRIFETTHQKPLVVSGTSREYAGLGSGGLNVFRDPTAHGLAHDGPMFASGDTGGFGSHGNIMYVPKTGTGYYLSGFDWLPRVGGVATLKKGMRLVPQVWHEASTTLTMSCSGVWPYRPHFVLFTPGQRAWGPPWSEWPEYEG